MTRTHGRHCSSYQTGIGSGHCCSGIVIMFGKLMRRLCVHGLMISLLRHFCRGLPCCLMLRKFMWASNLRTRRLKICWLLTNKPIYFLVFKAHSRKFNDHRLFYKYSYSYSYSYQISPLFSNHGLNYKYIQGFICIINIASMLLIITSW